MTNQEIAEVLDQMAVLLEVDDANPFRVRAYRMAAETIREEERSVGEMVAAAEPLTELEFVGKDLAAAIEELARTGQLAALEELSLRIPRTLLEVMRIPGVGPKKARRLWQELEVTTVTELEAAARGGKIAALKGFGPKTEESLIRRIERRREREREKEDQRDS